MQRYRCFGDKFPIIKFVGDTMQRRHKIVESVFIDRPKMRVEAAISLGVTAVEIENSLRATPDHIQREFARTEHQHDVRLKLGKGVRGVVVVERWKLPYMIEIENVYRFIVEPDTLLVIFPHRFERVVYFKQRMDGLTLNEHRVDWEPLA